jgi:hypothetical protein
MGFNSGFKGLTSWNPQGMSIPAMGLLALPLLRKVFVLCLMVIVCCESGRSGIISFPWCRFSMISDLHMSQSVIIDFTCTHVTVNSCSYKLCEVLVVIKEYCWRCKLHAVLTLVLDGG